MGGVRALFTAMFGGVTAVLFFMAVTRGGVGGAILLLMTPLPLFLVGLSQGTAFLGLAAMIATGIGARIGGAPLAAAFLLWMAAPALILVPVALSSGLPLRWPWQARAKTDDAINAALAAAPAIPLRPKGLGPNAIKPKRFFEQPAWRGLAAPIVEVPGRGGIIAGRLVLMLVLLGFAAFAGVMYYAQSVPGGLQGLEEQVLRQSLSMMQGAMPKDAAPMLDKAPVKLAVSASFGIATAFWLLILAVNGILAQGALASFDWNLRPAPELVSLMLPRWTVLIFALALAAAVLSRGMIATVGLNLAIICGVALLFEGLAVLHCIAIRSPAPKVFLVTAYMLGFALVGPVMLAAILGLGLSDMLFDVRRRIAAGAPRGEK